VGHIEEKLTIVLKRNTNLLFENQSKGRKV